MPKTSKIPHKTTTSLTINRELLAKAKEKGINISLLLDAALERELNPSCQEAHMKAISRKLDSVMGYFKLNPRVEEDYFKQLEEKAEKGGEKNVLVQKEGRKDNLKQALTNIRDS